jgi:hypothetical protein
LTLPKGKGKEKVFDKLLSSKPKTKGKSSPSPDEKYFHCHKKGHWLRRGRGRRRRRRSETSTSCINVVEINIAISYSDSWIFDTGLMIHIWKSLQGLRLTRRFAKGELNVHVGNGAKVAAIAVNTYHLLLPS